MRTRNLFPCLLDVKVFANLFLKSLPNLFIMQYLACNAPLSYREFLEALNLVRVDLASNSTRRAILCLQLLYIPLVIYVPALAFNQATGMDLYTIALLVCAVCIFYTTLVRTPLVDPRIEFFYAKRFRISELEYNTTGDLFYLFYKRRACNYR